MEEVSGSRSPELLAHASFSSFSSLYRFSVTLRSADWSSWSLATSLTPWRDVLDHRPIFSVPCPVASSCGEVILFHDASTSVPHCGDFGSSGRTQHLSSWKLQLMPKSFILKWNCHKYETSFLWKWANCCLDMLFRLPGESEWLPVCVSLMRECPPPPYQPHILNYSR